jgi:hypothetical protein
MIAIVFMMSLVGNASEGDGQPRLRLANPTTWPDQAGLAAAGEWDRLKALQDGLKGGRSA